MLANENECKMLKAYMKMLKAVMREINHAQQNELNKQTIQLLHDISHLILY